MIKKLHKSLGFRSIFLLSLIIIIVIGIISFLQLHSQKKIMWEKEMEKARGLSKAILTGIRYPMLTGDQDIIQKQFEYFREVESIKEISLLDHNGTIKRSTNAGLLDSQDKSEMVEHLLDDCEHDAEHDMVGVFKSNVGEHFFTEIVPIANSEACYACHGSERVILGALKVSVDWEKALAIIRATSNRNILLALISILVIGFAASIFLYRTIIFPVKKLESGMKKVSEGDMTVRLEPKTDDEIGFLMIMFNGMVEKIDLLIKKEEELMQAEKLRSQQLNILNINLEEEIIERKAMQNSLDSVNKELEEEIGERKLIEDNLVESEGMIRGLMDSIPHAIVGIADDRVIFANNGVKKVFGWTPDELIGNDIGKLWVSPQAGDSCYEMVRSTIEKNGKCEIDIMCKSKDLKQILCRLNAAFIKGSDGSLIRMVAVFEDITEIKEAENALRESAKKIREMYEIKSEFTSMVSHELRTPLTAIKEGIAIVLEGEAGEVNEDQKEFLGMAKRNVDRLKRLIDDVLDFAKLESKKLEFRMQKADINDAVIEVIKIHAPVARDKGLYLNQQLGINLPLIVFDIDRMLQVMNNLLSNAIKFTDSGGITVATAYDPEANSVIISVRDTGMGVKKEDLPKLFQKFQQLGGLNQRKTGGTGLGLAISKEIIEQHKGKVIIESEFGKGTVFKVILPVSPKSTILIIDDEEDLIELCRINLTEAGYNVLTSTTGQQGFLMATEKQPDLVISDIRLKDMNGLELVGWLKSDKSAQNIPVLLMSGFGDEISRMQKLPEDLALPWIAKPFKTEELIKAINTILKI